MAQQLYLATLFRLGIQTSSPTIMQTQAEIHILWATATIKFPEETIQKVVSHQKSLY